MAGQGVQVGRFALALTHKLITNWVHVHLDYDGFPTRFGVAIGEADANAVCGERIGLRERSGMLRLCAAGGGRPVRAVCCWRVKGRLSVIDFAVKSSLEVCALCTGKVV